MQTRPIQQKDDEIKTGNDTNTHTTPTGYRRGDGRESESSSFQFTFEYQRSSGGGSFIEPDTMSPEELDTSESLSESVQAYPEEYGRTYHAYRAPSYAFPNDSQERERLGLQHEAINRLLHGRLYLAPLSIQNPPRRILDIATGVGDWAIQMGDQFPDSHIIATDLSPIQPFEVPPRVEFFVEDSSEEWEYSMPFDYIHTRVTAGCWSNFKHQIARQAFDTLNPGGWFESQELDGAIHCDDNTLDPNSSIARWFRDIAKASAALDRPIIITNVLKKAYEEVGFVDVKEKIYKIPLNEWPRDPRLKEVGKMWESNMTQGLSGFTLYLLNKVFDRSEAEIEVELVNVRRDFANPRIHAYMVLSVVYGRKPFPGEGKSAPSTAT